MSTFLRRALFAPYDAFHKDQDDDVSGSLLATLWEVPAYVRLLALDLRLSNVNTSRSCMINCLQAYVSNCL